MYPHYETDKLLVSCVPSPRQLRHARMEFYGFICFNVNTFTDREWGTGKESPSIFAPTEYDPAQWIDAAARRSPDASRLAWIASATAPPHGSSSKTPTRPT